MLVLVVLLLIGYLIGYFSYRNKLLPNTYINNVDVSGMTVADAEQAVLNNASTQGITFIKKSGEKVHFNGEEFGSTVSLPDDAMQEVTSESHVLWFTKMLHKTAYDVAVINSYSESSLSNLFSLTAGGQHHLQMHISRREQMAHTVLYQKIMVI